MIVDPAIAALRRDQAMQRRIAERMERTAAAWRSLVQVDAIEQDIARYARGEALGDCARLAAIMENHAAAARFVDGFVTSMIAALHHEPLGEVCFSYTCAGGLSRIHLISTDQAALSVLAYEPLEHRAGSPVSAVFADRESVEIVVSGAGSGAFHALKRGGALQSKNRSFAAGDQMVCRAGSETRQIHSVSETLVILQLTRDAQPAGPTREVDLNNGKVLKTASGDKAASQALMAMAVLGAIGHHDAFDIMEQVALTAHEDADVRWEAVRQTLAMDAGRGLAL
ncbi:MAG: hypothetical protein AAFR88_12045, partial [Pseudomonadota bacterium]